MFRSHVLAAAALVAGLGGSALADIGDVYMYDLRSNPDQFFRVSLSNPSTRVFINTTVNYGTFALDFDPTASTLYCINNTTRELGTINPDTGDFTSIAAMSGIGATDNFLDLTIAPNGTAYMAAAGAAPGLPTLYTVNLATGAATAIAPFTGASLIIDLAVDRDGILYGHDIGTDTLVSIDPTTAVVTTIGPHGLAANFAQGMDVDWSTNTLYATIYTGGGTGRFVSWDTTTGAVTTLVDTTPWNMEMEMAVRSPIPGPASAGLLGVAGLLALRRRR